METWGDGLGLQTAPHRMAGMGPFASSCGKPQRTHDFQFSAQESIGDQSFPETGGERAWLEKEFLE